MLGPMSVKANPSGLLHDGSPITHGWFSICWRLVSTLTVSAIGSADAIAGNSAVVATRAAASDSNLYRMNILSSSAEATHCKERGQFRRIQKIRRLHRIAGKIR